MNLLKSTVLFLFISLLMNCSKSLVYSPSVNLPNKPLSKGESQILAGFVGLPEARPEKIDQKAAFGAEGTVRYAISDYFTMQVKGWVDLSNTVTYSRYGISIANIIALNDTSSDVIYGIMPTAAFLYGNEGFEAGGGSVPFLIWLPQSNQSTIYFAIGPGVGIRDIRDEANAWGWGIQGNVGFAYRISKKLSLNIEVANIYQINKSDDVSHYIFAPSINLGITL